MTNWHSWTPHGQTCQIVKFSDDTAMVGLISHDDESEYKQNVEQLED